MVAYFFTKELVFSEESPVRKLPILTTNTTFSSHGYRPTLENAEGDHFRLS